MQHFAVAPEPVGPDGRPDPLDALIPPATERPAPSRPAVPSSAPPTELPLIGDPAVPARGDWRALWSRVRSDPRASWVLLLVAALVTGLIWYRMGIDDEAPIASTTTTAMTATAGAGSTADGDASGGANAAAVTATRSGSAHTAAPVVVHVAGAVLHPGVVQLASGSRVVDAITAVGGATLDADVNRLNLAAKLVDGQRIAVPKYGEVIPPAVGIDPAAGVDAGAPAGDGTPTSENPLDLNTATATQLESLPGIGPSLAQAIIAERTKRGGFQSVNDLRSVRGIGDGRFADLKDYVRV